MEENTTGAQGAQTTTTAVHTKYCKRCRRERPAADFYARSDSKDGLQPYCKECQRELQKKRMESCKGLNPDLEPFTPRQLIEELRARGYTGELKITSTIKV